jgi:hypothetical protein
MHKHLWNAFLAVNAHSGWTFLATDIAGALLSLLALAVQHTFDVLGGTGYILVLFLEVGIVVVQIIWLWRTRKIRKQAKKVGMDYDEYISRDESNVRDEEGKSYLGPVK